MKFCYKCGEKIFTEAEICPKCGVRQMHPPGYSAPPPAQNPSVPGSASPQNPQPQNQQNPPQYAERKSPAIAAILSFFWSGLGHIYCGDWGFGIMLILGFPVIAFLCSITIVCIPFIFIMWLWAIFDAYGLAQRINRGEVR